MWQESDLRKRRRIRSNRVSWAGFTSLEKKKKKKNRDPIRGTNFEATIKVAWSQPLFSLPRSNREEEEGEERKKEEEEEEKENERKRRKKGQSMFERIVNTIFFFFFTPTRRNSALRFLFLHRAQGNQSLWTFNKTVFTRWGVNRRSGMGLGGG